MIQPIENLATIIKSKDLQQYKGDFFHNILKAICLEDTGAITDIVNNSAQMVFHMPNILFWDKMERFLYGTYSNFEEQVKMASKFGTDDEYVEFTKRQINLINDINDNMKIDYFAKLTRALLLELIDSELYFKLSEILLRCTREELNYLKENYTTNEVELNIYIESFVNVGLAKMSILQADFEGNGSLYKYTKLAEKLDKYALSYNEKSYNYHKKDKYSALGTFQTCSEIGFIAEEE